MNYGFFGNYFHMLNCGLIIGLVFFCSWEAACKLCEWWVIHWFLCLFFVCSFFFQMIFLYFILRFQSLSSISVITRENLIRRKVVIDWSTCWCSFWFSISDLSMTSVKKLIFTDLRFCIYCGMGLWVLWYIIFTALLFLLLSRLLIKAN